MSSLRQMRILKAIWFFSVHSCNNNNSLKIQSHVARVGFYITDVLQSRRKKMLWQPQVEEWGFLFYFFLTSNFTDTAGDAQKKNVVKFKYSEWIKLYSIHSISKQDLNMPYVSSSRDNSEYVEIRETRILQFVSKEVIFYFIGYYWNNFTFVWSGVIFFFGSVFILETYLCI